MVSLITAYASAPDIRFDMSVSDSERLVINRDFANLCRLNYRFDGDYPAAYADLRRLFDLFGIGEPSCGRLKRWLEERIGIITRHLDYASPDPDEWRPRYFPIHMDILIMRSYLRSLTSRQGTLRHINAFNLSPIVAEIKDEDPNFSESDDIAFLYIPEAGEYSFEPASSRRGIIFLRRAFFTPGHGLHHFSIAGSLLRLGLLFHEARHSDDAPDQNGVFRPKLFHVPCEDGRTACDVNIGGSHGIRFAFLAFASYACDTCTEGEKEILRLEALESYRLINP